MVQKVGVEDHRRITEGSPCGRQLSLVRHGCQLAVSAEPNVIRLLFDQHGAWRERLDNWEHLAAYGLAKLQDDLPRLPHDTQRRDLADLVPSTALSQGNRRCSIDCSATRLSLMWRSCEVVRSRSNAPGVIDTGVARLMR